jgi:hypothetical protein
MGLAKAKVPYEKVLPDLRTYAASHAFGGKIKRRKVAKSPGVETPG